jgi:hypothetical protein
MGRPGMIQGVYGIMLVVEGLKLIFSKKLDDTLRVAFIALISAGDVLLYFFVKNQADFISILRIFFIICYR